MSRRKHKKKKGKRMGHWTDTPLLPYQSTIDRTQSYANNVLDTTYIWPETMKHRCLAPIDDFKKYGQVYNTPDGIYIYKDNGANILAVAHLDTVQDPTGFSVVGDRIYTPTLDDRLGAYLILDVLPKLLGEGSYDILFTEGEESGRSTAKHFQKPEGKEYNWIFEIDRMGSQTVMYQYDCPELRQKLTKHGLDTGWGSFTDICYLDFLEVKAINFACYYNDNHGLRAWVDCAGLHKQIPKIVSFIQEFMHEKMPHDPKESRRHYGSNFYAWNDYSEWSGCTTSYGGYAGPKPNTVHRSNYRNGAGTRYYNQSAAIDEIAGDYVIVTCPECEAECFRADINCPDCGHFLHTTDECIVCGRRDCRQIVKCPLCGFGYHDDPFIKEIGQCRECLATIYEGFIDDTMLDNIELADIECDAEALRKSVDIVKAAIDT